MSSTLDGAFHHTHLQDINQILWRRYRDTIATYEEKRDERGYLTETVRIFTNATHQITVRNITGKGLWYREEPVSE